MCSITLYHTNVGKNKKGTVVRKRQLFIKTSSWIVISYSSKGETFRFNSRRKSTIKSFTPSSVAFTKIILLLLVRKDRVFVDTKEYEKDKQSSTFWKKNYN